MVGLLAAVGDILTPRQRAVLALMAEGKASWEIAQELGINPNTVKDYMVAIWDRLVSPRNRALWAALISHSQKTTL